MVQACSVGMWLVVSHSAACMQHGRPFSDVTGATPAPHGCPPQPGTLPPFRGPASVCKSKNLLCVARHCNRHDHQKLRGEAGSVTGLAAECDDARAAGSMHRSTSHCRLTRHSTHCISAQPGKVSMSSSSSSSRVCSRLKAHTDSSGQSRSGIRVLEKRRRGRQQTKRTGVSRLQCSLIGYHAATTAVPKMDH